MTIDDRYRNILNELFDNIDNIKGEIIGICKLDGLNVNIERFNEPIKDDKGNNSFGAFYKDENKIKINEQELINFVGQKICYKYSKLHCSGDDNDIKIFKYYTFYVIAHEMHHAYLYSSDRKKYDDIKKGDSNKEYKDKELEELADNCAKNYLYHLNNDIAKHTVDLAIGLRTKSYNSDKSERETDEERKLRFIEELLIKIQI